MATHTEQTGFIINGTVVDRATQAGVRGVRVEAWDRDTRYHDLLGQAFTRESGEFAIAFDTHYFGDYAPDRAPDVYFRLFLDGREVHDTFDVPMKNAGRRLDVRLELEMPQLQQTGTDRISAQQTLKAVDWWRASDFKGAWREGRDKAGTLGKLIGGSAGRSLGKFDFQPVRPTGTRERDIVNQDVDSAHSALALHQVEVAQVKPVAPGTRDNLRALRDYPLHLKAGDRVILHEENGVVKYYSRATALDAENIDQQAVARLDGDVQALKVQTREIDALRAQVDQLQATDASVGERIGQGSADARQQAADIARLREELQAFRERSAAKDREIAELRKDLTTVRQAQDKLIGRLSTDPVRLPADMPADEPVSSGRKAKPAPSSQPAASAATAASDKPRKKAAASSPKAPRAAATKKPGPMLKDTQAAATKNAASTPKDTRAAATKKTRKATAARPRKRPG